MDSASPSHAGIGSESARDAQGVAFTAQAETFKWDWKRATPRSKWGADSGFASAFARRRPARRQRRRAGHPPATGDGHR